MPRHLFDCDSCGHSEQANVPFGSDIKHVCPVCGADMRRVFQARADALIRKADTPGKILTRMDQDRKLDAHLAKQKRIAEQMNESEKWNHGVAKWHARKVGVDTSLAPGKKIHEEHHKAEKADRCDEQGDAGLKEESGSGSTTD